MSLINLKQLLFLKPFFHNFLRHTHAPTFYKHSHADAYSEPCQTIEMVRFVKTLLHRCMTGFWICLCHALLDVFTYSFIPLDTHLVICISLSRSSIHSMICFHSFMDYVPQAINFVSALGQGFNRENQKFFPISLGNKFHEANFFLLNIQTYYLFFLQTRLFKTLSNYLQKSKTYLYRCSFRPENISGENITWNNPMQWISLFFAWNNFRKNFFGFYVFKECKRLLLLRYKKLLL